MPELIIKEIRSIREFTEYINYELMPKKGILWYRGSRRSKYELIPRLYRPKRDLSDLLRLEKDMVNWFYERSIPHCTRELPGAWEKLFFMQHYGVPTRLLDWTESPLIALYFAIEPKKGAGGESKLPKEEKDASVWVLDPCIWNKAATGNFNGGYETIFSIGDEYEVLKGYDLSIVGEGGTLLPIALNGMYNSYRIAAQRGVFTVFGANTKPMEAYYQEDAKVFKKGSLTKIVIPYDKKREIYSSLLAWGITETSILPDLDGLARETRRIFNFGEEDA